MPRARATAKIGSLPKHFAISQSKTAKHSENAVGPTLGIHFGELGKPGGKLTGCSPPFFREALAAGFDDC